MAPTTLAKAVNMGLRKAMESDPKVLVMGEDVGKLGGVFRVTDGLQKDFGEARVIDTPLAESATPPPLHSATVVRPGDDLTVLAYGPMVRTALEAAAAAADEGRSLEVIDLRTLSPLDLVPVLESVRRTGRCVVVHEAPVFLGMGSELAARITEACFYSLEAPVLRVGGFDTPYPPSRLEEAYLPDLDRVLDAVDHAFAF